MIIAFEGLDQSGKQTQVELLHLKLRENGYPIFVFSFPAYHTPLGNEISCANRNERSYSPETLQLIYAANKMEFADEIREANSEGIVICDRYIYSAVAYGLARGVKESSWLLEIQRLLTPATITFLLDIDVDTSVQRKREHRDAFEANLPLLMKARGFYHHYAKELNWVVLDGCQERSLIADQVWQVVQDFLLES